MRCDDRAHLHELSRWLNIQWFKFRRKAEHSKARERDGGHDSKGKTGLFSDSPDVFLPGVDDNAKARIHLSHVVLSKAATHNTSTAPALARRAAPRSRLKRDRLCPITR